MSHNRSEQEIAGSLTRLIGTFYLLIGGAGMIVLLLSRRPQGFEVFNDPVTIIAMAVLFLVLIVIGLVMAVPKPDPKARFRR